MANRSTFLAPDYQLDSFLELSELPPERYQDAVRLQDLKRKINKTPEEINEMNNLMLILQSYFISAETWNKFCDCLVNVETKVKNEIDVVNDTTNMGVANINTNKDNALNEIEQKKENIINYMDATTAGQIKNDLGVKGDLQTTDKSSLVNAINEVKNNQVTDLNKHLSDYVRQPAYAVTTGTANAYLVSTDPAPTEYVDGMGIAIKINVSSTGASTLNWNGLGVKNIVDSNKNAVTNLKANAIYSLKYETTSKNFILQSSDNANVFVESVDPAGITGYTVKDKNIWFDTTNEIIKVRVSGKWVPQGAVYK